MRTTRMTKSEEAQELLMTVRNGPEFLCGSKFLREKYQLWSQTWVIPSLIRLVPQLKDNHNEKKTT